MGPPQLIFLAGPNGAGKSTFFRAELARLGLPFLNADEFKKETGVTDMEAQQFLDQARSLYLAQKKSFITETVFSDPVGAKLRFLADAVAAGYDVRVIFIGLDSPESCDARVISRVMAGGHDVPQERIARRYTQSLLNLRTALITVPHVEVYDNSGDEEARHLILRLQDSRLVWRKDVLPDWLAGVLGQDYGR